MKHRKTVIVGNWKMNTDVQSGINLAKQILDLSNNITNVEKITFLLMSSLNEIISFTNAGIRILKNMSLSE